MKRRYLLCPLLTFICSSAIADHMALITVDPNLFAPGQNISHATTGAQLLAMTIVANPDPNFPNTFVPHYSPTVYAQPVDPSCTLISVVPCALNGNLTFGYTATTIPTTDRTPLLWGEVNVGACELDPQCGFNAVYTQFPILRVNFTKPTDYAAAIVGYWMLDGAAIQGFEAFDSGGQSVAKCIGYGPFSLPAGCSSIVLSDPNNADAGGWVQVTISRPTADISFVLIGGEGNIRPIAQMQFNSPVSLQLHGLERKVRDLRPLGNSLEHKVMFAESYYEVHDIGATCAQLTAFEHEVRAQGDKHIPDLTALQLLSTATAITDALDCGEPKGHGPQPWD